MQKQLQKTILFVSHDIDEAVKMGSKIAIFSAGKLEQFDTPDNVLAHPAKPFIADFVGADPDGQPERFITDASPEPRGGTCREHSVPIAACTLITANLRAAVSKMFENNITWLACVDESGRFVGTLDQHAVTHMLGKTYAVPVEA